MKVRTLTAITLLTVLLLTVLALLLSGPATAQGPEPSGHQPPSPKDPWLPGSLHDGPYQTPDGLWVMPAGAHPPLEVTGVSPQATGGPDNFGYTWDDSVPLSWINASGGTDTGINSSTDHVGPINIGFSFKYYENAYTQLYISRFGFVAFNDNNIYNSQSRIPNPEKPNDVIAPHWVPADDVNGYVRYLSGGTAPNRWFVVEWNRLESDCCGDTAEEYTFEVILHENGDIVFQYGTMTVGGRYYCQASGIEDSTGLNGLSITDFCEQIAPNHAVRIYRPAPSARVSIRPQYQGHFARAGETVAFQVPIRNTGELGADTYDLTASSAWPISFYAADGTTPLTDTDGDGTVDTGSVVQGSTVTVTVRITTPVGATVGDDNTATVTARSSLDTDKSKTATLQTAVPAPFAQVYRDGADGAMSLYLVQPAAQAVKNWYYGYEVAVAEAPNGNFVYAWNKRRCLDASCNVYSDEIWYALLDRTGNVVRGPERLTNNWGATVNTYDIAPVVAVAPNGRIGVVWYRYLWNSSTQQNYNIYFAILDASGNRVYGPVNLTNNAAWGSWSDLNVPKFYFPRIAATDDNRFVLAWQRTYYRPPTGSCTSYCSVDDIFYTVRDTSGNQIKPVTRFTNDTPGWDQGYYRPTLAQLSGNQVIMAWDQTANYSDNIAYAVLDSAGNVIVSTKTVNMSGWEVDAVRLSNGRILLAWTVWGDPNPQMAFAILDGTTYNVVAGPTTLTNPAAATGDGYVSVTADAAGHAVLTWMDYFWDNRRNLYYALVDGNGNVLTPPMIFRTSQAASPYIQTSFEGYGNTSYSWTPPVGVDGVASFSASLFGGPPGGNAAVGVRAANHGTTTATNVVLTATLVSGLTYVSDTSGITPAISGDDVVWNLPDLGFLDNFDFTLYVRLPSEMAYGTRYPITLTLASAGLEANSSDNTASAQVMMARQVFLPLVFRDYP